MAPVTLIVGGLAAGALKGAGETATAALKDAYTALKAALAARFAERQPSGGPLARSVPSVTQRDGHAARQRRT